MKLCMTERFLCGKPQENTLRVIVSSAALRLWKTCDGKRWSFNVIKQQKSFNPHLTATSTNLQSQRIQDVTELKWNVFFLYKRNKLEELGPNSITRLTENAVKYIQQIHLDKHLISCFDVTHNRNKLQCFVLPQYEWFILSLGLIHCRFVVIKSYKFIARVLPKASATWKIETGFMARQQLFLRVLHMNSPVEHTRMTLQLDSAFLLLIDVLYNKLKSKTNCGVNSLCLLTLSIFLTFELWFQSELRYLWFIVEQTTIQMWKRLKGQQQQIAIRRCCAVLCRAVSLQLIILVSKNYKTSNIELRRL